MTPFGYFHSSHRAAGERGKTMVDLADGKKTHNIFESEEVPWIFRGGETKPDHLDILEIVKRSGVDLGATFVSATGKPFDPEVNLLITAKPLRFHKGKVIPLHTHLNDLYRFATIVMLKRITTPCGIIRYTDGTDESDNGSQDLSTDQWAVVDSRMTYFGEILMTEGPLPYVEMDLFHVRLVNEQGQSVAVDPEQVIPASPNLD